MVWPVKTLLVINVLITIFVGYIAYVSLDHVSLIESILVQIISSAPGQDS